jgi:hypothetical protein
MLHKVEVRCCCIPRKLLGWIEINKTPEMGDKWQFPLDIKTEGQQVPYYSIPINPHMPVKHRTITLGIEGINLSKDRMAFKSDETPIEDLRRIFNFTENKEPYHGYKDEEKDD